MVIYMDDTLLFDVQTKEQHHAIVIWVLDILHRQQLYLKAKKRHVWTTHDKVS